VATAEDLQFDGVPPFVQATAGGQFFFTAFDPSAGPELLVSDGTPAGTRVVRDIFPGNIRFSPAPANLTAVGSLLFFTADDGIHGQELWLTDGTLDGTRQVIDLFPSQ
jgi:ELWxxDGT repeat protein